MVKSYETLSAVAAAQHALVDAKAQLKIEADAWVERKLAEKRADVERAVMAALEDQHGVTAVAEAYTITGKTPRRNDIYAIKAKHADQADLWVGDYPFEWVERIVKTPKGERTVYDVTVSVEDFGPEDLTGNFTWRYDSGELEAVIGFGPDEVWPTSKYYKQVLDRWLLNNPYPGED